MCSRAWSYASAEWPPCCRCCGSCASADEAHWCLCHVVAHDGLGLRAIVVDPDPEAPNVPAVVVRLDVRVVLATPVGCGCWAWRQHVVMALC